MVLRIYAHASLLQPCPGGRIFFASNSRAKPSRVLSVAETWLRKRRDFFAFSLTSLSLQCKQLKTAQKNTEAEDKAMPVFVEFLLCMFQQLRITMIKRSE